MKQFAVFFFPQINLHTFNLNQNEGGVFDSSQPLNPKICFYIPS